MIDYIQVTYEIRLTVNSHSVDEIQNGMNANEKLNH